MFSNKICKVVSEISRIDVVPKKESSFVIHIKDMGRLNSVPRLMGGPGRLY